MAKKKQMNSVVHLRSKAGNDGRPVHTNRIKQTSSPPWQNAQVKPVRKELLEVREKEKEK